MSKENNFIPSQDGYKPLTPFKLFIKSNFPFIENTYESLDNYGLYCKIVEYLNNVISNENTVESNVGALYDAFVSLNTYVSNYFDNLDVQKEINEKLDEMAASGELSAILNSYIKPIYNEFEQTISNRVNEQDILINNINNKVNASVGISPIAVDNISQMTDTSRIYVLSSDGNWYYYNGTTWLSGGVYQATSYGENSIPSKSIKNLIYDKINNNIIAKTLSVNNFHLNGATISEDDTSITIRRTSKTSNAQFRIDFNFDELQLAQHIMLNISNLRCIPFMNITTSNNKDLKNFILKNGESHILLDAEDVKAKTTIIFSLYANTYPGVSDGEIIATINKDYFISNTSFFDYKSNDNLSTFLNSLTKYNGITNRQEFIELNSIYGNQKAVSEIIRTGNNLNFTTTENNVGLKTNSIKKTSSTLHIKGKVNNLSDDPSIYVITHDKDNVENYNYYPLHANDVIDISLDLAYLAVYQNMKSFIVVINGKAGTYKIDDLQIYVDDLSDMEIYSDNLGDIIRNIQNKFSQIDSDLIGNNLVVTSPNNTKYRIVVDNDGNLSTTVISLIPSKGLFIGNSLLQGFGTHGMASYSVNDDYYHYVNEHLKTLNENYVSSKISGTDWESATTVSQVNNYINNTIIPNMTPDTNVVFIQLGDNCNTAEKINFIPTKAPMLINAIKKINPNTKIYWVASWYNSTAKQNYITNVCSDYNVKYINIAPLSKPENQAYIGYEYIDSNGETQQITSAGVASHPSSSGMKKIADKIIENL